MRLACVHQPHSSLYCSGARFLSAVLMLAEKSEPDKGAPAPSHQARTSISLGSPWNTESGWKWPSEPLTRTEHLAQVLQTRGGSMLLAVRVPQDHVKPRTERCGGQRSRRGAIGAALLQPLPEASDATARAGQSVLKGLRLANEHLGKATPDRGPSRRTGAVAPRAWSCHWRTARWRGTATATGPSGSHDGREKGRGEQGQGRNGGRGKSNGRARTDANLWQGALASGSN